MKVKVFEVSHTITFTGLYINLLSKATVLIKH